MLALDNWPFWILIGLLLCLAPFAWYANQAGHDAVSEGRAKNVMGQVPYWVKYDEVSRLAREGSQFAKITLVVMKFKIVLPLVVVLGMFLLPVLKRVLNIEW